MFLSAAILVFLVNFGQSARILGVFQVPSFSHQCVFQPIWRELSLRGHEVIVVTPNPLNDPSLTNLTEIDTSSTYNTIRSHCFQCFMSKEVWIFNKIPRIFELNYDLAETVLSNEKFKKIYENPNEKFDVILVQTFISPVLYSLSAKFGAPTIGISSFGGWVGSHYAIGNPNHPAVFSEMFLPYNGRLTLVERIYSTAYAIWSRLYIHFVALPYGDEIVKKYLGEDMPYLGDSERNLSMLFLNTNPILYPARPTVPSIITMGQMHIKPVQPLEKGLKDVLDNAENGVIYFSLGSNVRSVDIPDTLKQTLIEGFSELPYTVLWKWEADDMPNKPKNIVIKKWLPQQDVLAHPNIKVFITQCGLQSIEEAVSRGVPIIGMPFIADQLMNIRKLEEFGVGVGIEYTTLTKQELVSAVMEVAGKEKYKKKVLELQNLFNDQPMTGLQRAVWWIEYVIRHKGAKYLKSPISDLPWYQFLMLDIIGIFVVLLAIIILIIKSLINLIFLREPKDRSKKQN